MHALHLLSICKCRYFDMFTVSGRTCLILEIYRPCRRLYPLHNQRYQCWWFVPRQGFSDLGWGFRVGSRYIFIGADISVLIFGVPGVMPASICVIFPVQETQVVARAACATWWFRTGRCTMVRLNTATIEVESI